MKVCFVYDPEPNERYLQILSKMTPNRSGVWKDMVGVSRIEEADWCVVIDKTNQNVPLDRTVFVSAHPIMLNYHGYVDNTDKPHRLDNAETFGFGEWWLSYDYDYLSNLKPMDKTKDICCIMSNTGGGWGRDQRKQFARSFGDKINLYGRIEGGVELGENTPDKYWFGKEPVLAEHRYSIEVDVGVCKNYFSERFFDSLLMWCMPLYWGCNNVHEFIPKEAFKYIDIYGDGSDIFGVERNLEAIAEARDLLLNKYQIWGRVYGYIKNHS